MRRYCQNHIYLKMNIQWWKLLFLYKGIAINYYTFHRSDIATYLWIRACFNILNAFFNIFRWTRDMQEAQKQDPNIFWTRLGIVQSQKKNENKRNWTSMLTRCWWAKLPTLAPKLPTYWKIFNNRIHQKYNKISEWKGVAQTRILIH